jgi:hypothetical protein
VLRWELQEDGSLTGDWGPGGHGAAWVVLIRIIGLQLRNRNARM